MSEVGERKAARKALSSGIDAGMPPEVSPQPEKRKRGRPRKIVPETVVSKPAGKRGRPRKHPLPDPAAPPRKRGRPRKAALLETTAHFADVSLPQAISTLPSAPAPAVLTASPAALVPSVAPADSAPLPASEPPPKTSKSEPGSSSKNAPDQDAPGVDFNALAVNMARFMEEGGKAFAAYMRPIEEGKTNPDMAEHVEDAVKTFGHVAEYWLADPARTI